MIFCAQLEWLMISSDKDSTSLWFRLLCDLCIVTLLGFLHDGRESLFKRHHLLLEGNQSCVDLLGYLTEVLNHGLQLWNNLSFGFLKQNAIYESPALSIIFQSVHLFKNHPTESSQFSFSKCGLLTRSPSFHLRPPWVSQPMHWSPTATAGTF